MAILASGKGHVQHYENQWPKVLELFLFFKKAQGLSERTLIDYNDHVSRFFLKTGAKFSEYDDLRSAILKYFGDSASLAPATFNTRRKTLSSFFSWAMNEQYIPKNPMADVKKRKEDNKPRAARQEDIQRLLTLPSKHTFAGIRDRAHMLLTMDTGIRPSEVNGLRIRDFNPKAGQITIPPEVAKTRISRTLPILPITIKAIEELISVRHASWGDDVPIFCTEGGKPLNRFAWGKCMRKYSEKLGVKITPYMLRHSFATMFLRGGGNAFALQKTMGHTTMAMTRRYIDLTQGDLEDQHSLASPLNVLLPQSHRVRRIKR